MNLTETKYTIGKTAARLAVSTDTLRHYEKNGLITPTSKTTAGYRLYNEDVVYRVRFIKQAQSCGLTLSDIRQLLTLKKKGNCACADVRKLATKRKLQVSYKLAVLETSLHALDDLIMKCDDGGSMAINSSPILGNLDIK